MLVLTRKPGERIMIGNAYEVEIVSVARGVVKFAFYVNRPVFLMPGNVEIEPPDNGVRSAVKVTRKVDDSVVFEDGPERAIEVLVVSVKGEAVRVGVKAPRDIQVHRQEVWEEIQRENIAASQRSELDLDQLRKLLPPQVSLGRPELKDGAPGPEPKE